MTGKRLEDALTSAVLGATDSQAGTTLVQSDVWRLFGFLVNLDPPKIRSCAGNEIPPSFRDAGVGLRAWVDAEAQAPPQ